MIELTVEILADRVLDELYLADSAGRRAASGTVESSIIARMVSTIWRGTIVEAQRGRDAAATPGGVAGATISGALFSMIGTAPGNI